MGCAQLQLSLQWKAKYLSLLSSWSSYEILRRKTRVSEPNEKLMINTCICFTFKKFHDHCHLGRISAYIHGGSGGYKIWWISISTGKLWIRSVLRCAIRIHQNPWLISADICRQIWTILNSSMPMVYTIKPTEKNSELFISRNLLKICFQGFEVTNGLTANIYSTC